MANDRKRELGFYSIDIQLDFLEPTDQAIIDAFYQDVEPALPVTDQLPPRETNHAPYCDVH